MGGNEVNTELTIQKALEIARDSEGGIDPTVARYLEQAIREIWNRVEAASDSYILSKDEFALFNYYLPRYPSSSIAQRAIQRFWDNYQGEPTNAQQDGASSATSGANGAHGTNGA